LSKLFDTLEEIQHQEEQLPPFREPVRTPHSSKKMLKPLLLGALVVAGVFAGYNYLQIKKAVVMPQSAAIVPQLKDIGVKLIPPSVDSTSVSQAEFYNNLGVSQARKGQYWEAIYSFEKATAASPDMIEPYVNQGTALLSLNLTSPARRYLQKAYSLDPENKALQDTLSKAQFSEAESMEFGEDLATGGGQ
jgi:tetratricopeptide (TPR) repeat protein